MATVRSMAALEVRDPTAAIAFYEKLGFGRLGVWDDPGSIATAIMQRGDVTILLQTADAPAVNSGLAVYIYIDDPDGLQATFLADGVDAGPVEDAFYGCREFEVIDPDGHHLMFGKDMNDKPYGHGLGPDRGKG